MNDTPALKLAKAKLALSIKFRDCKCFAVYHADQKHILGYAISTRNFEQLNSTCDSEEAAWLLAYRNYCE